MSFSIYHKKYSLWIFRKFFARVHQGGNKKYFIPLRNRKIDYILKVLTFPEKFRHGKFYFYLFMEYWKSIIGDNQIFYDHKT